MTDNPLIRDKTEALDHLILEKGLVDARVLAETAFRGCRAWLTTSQDLSPGVDEGDQHWLLSNGRIVTTNIVGPSTAEEYENQYGEPFPRPDREMADG